MQQPRPVQPMPQPQAPIPPPPQAPISPPPSQPPALAPGTLLAGRYLIQGYIGGGGFGHIYKAQDKVLGHRRAIKEAFYRDAQTQRQFRLEAEFLLNAHHANLVRGYAVFEQAGRFYLVMDYVDGHTLEEINIQHIRRTGRPLPEAQVLDWILPICESLEGLHRQPTPIIHRDVKPANIKLTRQGTPILIDLGLAKLYNAGTQTLGAALAFTPGYAPPEQYQASGATDQRTDVYGMGATLYYLLTGYQPTEAPARLGPHALPAPRALNPSLSPATEAVILRAMTLDPAGRQQSAGILLAELRAARAGLTVAPPQSGELGTKAASGNRFPVLACVRCGTANPAAARFCMRCGSPLSLETPAESSGDDMPTGMYLVAPRSGDAAESSNGVFDEQSGDEASASNLAEPAATSTPISFAQPVQPGAAPGSPFATGHAGAEANRAQRVAGAIGWLAQPFGDRTPAQAEESLAVIAAVLAVVCASLSLVGLLHRWMLVFTAPALFLAWWSLQHQKPTTPPEITKIAVGTLIATVAWVVIRFVFWLVFHR
ncbi:MAG TPA: protein kinase [Ktedonobacterales bacterium]|nr:protein kinase [Ktedonobacterales bacterium]